MSGIQISPEDTVAASKSLALLQSRHGHGRALELALAQIRVDAAYLARWTGPSVAARVLAEEAHRVVTEAAAQLAVPSEASTEAQRSQAGRGKQRRLVTVRRAAVWSTGILTGFALGLGVSGWALG